MLMLLLVGLAAEIKKLHYQFQANTVKKHRVLSLIFLGLQVIYHGLEKITKKDLKIALNAVQKNENQFYKELMQ